MSQQMPKNEPSVVTTETQPEAPTQAPEARKSSMRPAAPISLAELTANSTEEWFLSYADMVTLLLTMFVALLLNAHFEKPGGQSEGAGNGARGVIENLLQLNVESPYMDGGGYTITGTRDVVSVTPPDPGTALAVVKDDDLDRIRARELVLSGIREKLKTAQLDAFISASIEGDGIRLNIPNSILFNTGAADLQGRGPSVIRALAPILADARFVVSVEGHTDNVPIKTDRFPSNWELSAQRAATVVRVLAEGGIDAHRLEAVGYADSRPLADNANEDGRRENRRVALLLKI